MFSVGGGRGGGGLLCYCLDGDLVNQLFDLSTSLLCSCTRGSYPSGKTLVTYHVCYCLGMGQHHVLRDTSTHLYTFSPVNHLPNLVDQLFDLLTSLFYSCTRRSHPRGETPASLSSGSSP